MTIDPKTKIQTEPKITDAPTEVTDQELSRAEGGGYTSGSYTRPGRTTTGGAGGDTTAPTDTTTGF